ncbi:F-box/kelch-repeat protein At1g67480-like [Selaginella moellendorffii]|uniref:F-box/kelch-repeat protein At1g67480-like n=1 Tax=Selaginella moellendorffii TaxID=88036 RepID=UPI000D1CEA27|nr:F-box/kelch-repeat protein At1g67480-like [Selaginella moellendorffii]|eukprot:XP_024530610.1 F-box/kelch-repeat protein At1g67480-like [Selaginella moellendorffii]
MGCRASRPIRSGSHRERKEDLAPCNTKWIGYVSNSPNFSCAEQERRLRRANLEPVRDEEDEEDCDGFQFAIAGGESPCSSSSLIPGLPDDVARLCLMRLPCVKYSFSYRLVSKSWRSLLSSPDFYSERRHLPRIQQQASVCVVIHGNRVRVFNTVTCQWFSLPPLPHSIDDEDPDPAIRIDPYDWWRIDTVAVADGNLFVIGGEESRIPSSRVHRYDFCHCRWEEMAPMGIARSHSAAVTVGGRVYVAGGTSAEVFVPSENSWTTISGLKRAMRSCVGIEHQGKVFVKGENCQGAGSPIEAQVYDPSGDEWNRMVPKLKAGLTRGPVASSGAAIFVADWKDLQLKAFNPELESWDVAGQLPARLSRLVGHGAQLYGFTGKIKVDSVNHRVISGAPTEVWKLDIGREGIRNHHPLVLQWECIWRGAKNSTKVGGLTWAPSSAHCALLED